MEQVEEIPLEEFLEAIGEGPTTTLRPPIRRLFSVCTEKIARLLFRLGTHNLDILLTVS